MVGIKSTISFYVAYLFEQALQASEYFLETKGDYSEYGFSEYRRIHFGIAKHTVHKYNRHLDYLEFLVEHLVLHLYLERITLKLNFVQIQSLEHLSAIAYKAGGSIAEGHSGDNPDIHRGEIGHEYASHGPVNHIYTRYVAGPYRHVSATVLAFMI